MGASTVAAHLLLFIAVLSITAGMVITLNNYVAQTGLALHSKQEATTSRLKTNVEITNVKSTTTWVATYVKNTGSEKLKTECMEYYIDDNWQAKTDFTITDPDTGSNVTLVDLKQTIKLNTSLSQPPLNESDTHKTKIVTCNGVSDSDLFSIG